MENITTISIAITLGMGVSALVLRILDNVSTEIIIIIIALLSIGVTYLALVQLQDKPNKH